MSVVHDASSLLAIAFVEPGSERARAALRDSLVSSVNWSEVLQKILVRGGDPAPVARLFGGLGVTIVPFDIATAERAARLYPVTKSLGLSLGDRACLALGVERSREIYTADRAWTALPLPVEVTAIR